MIPALILVAIIFALNMGGSGFGVAFAAAYGSKVIRKPAALLLFTGFVILGALLFGPRVSKTLGSGLIPSRLITLNVCLIIFGTATLCLLLANLVHIPQSTSMVTVAAITGVGLSHHQINLKGVLTLIPYWVILPLLSYIVTRKLLQIIYPPRRKNYWFYEKFINYEQRLKKFVLFTNSYNAFAIGSNNVANVVGPLVSAGIIGAVPGLLLCAPLFGLGGLIFHRSLETAGKEMIPLGVFSASLVSLAASSLLLFASVMGIPQSFVQLKMGAIFAIAGIKDGQAATMDQRLTKKVLLLWIANPVLALVMAYLFTGVFT